MTGAYAKHIGLVGALAVALGVSGAMGTMPGVAWADESPSGASSSSTSSESNSTSPPSTSEPSSTPASSDSSSDLSHDESVGHPRKPSGSGSSELVIADESGVIVRNSGGSHTSRSDDPTIAPDDDSVARDREDTPSASEIDGQPALQDEALKPAKPRNPRHTSSEPSATDDDDAAEKDSGTVRDRSPAATGDLSAATGEDASGIRLQPSADTTKPQLVPATGHQSTDSTSQLLDATPAVSPARVSIAPQPIAGLIRVALAPFLDSGPLWFAEVLLYF